MAVNPDAANRLKVSFRQPRAGSCLTPEVLAEIADLLDIQIPSDNNSDAPRISQDSNNLARLDAQNGILVPGATIYNEEQTWEVATGADVDFEGFVREGIDPQACFFGCYLLLGSGETGTPVQGDPTGTEHIRPQYEIKALTATKITIAVQNAKSDVTVKIQLLQLPVPSEPA